MVFAGMAQPGAFQIRASALAFEAPGRWPRESKPCCNDSPDSRVRVLTTAGPPVDLMLHHGGAYSSRERARLEGRIRDGAILVLFDSHADLMDQVGLAPRPTTPEEADRIEYDIASHIVPSIADGLVSEVVHVGNRRLDEQGRLPGHLPGVRRLWVVRIKDTAGVHTAVLLDGERPTPSDALARIRPVPGASREVHGRRARANTANSRAARSIHRAVGAREHLGEARDHTHDVCRLTAGLHARLAGHHPRHRRGFLRPWPTHDFGWRYRPRVCGTRHSRSRGTAGRTRRAPTECEHRAFGRLHAEGQMAHVTASLLAALERRACPNSHVFQMAIWPSRHTSVPGTRCPKYAQRARPQPQRRAAGRALSKRLRSARA